MLLFLLDCDVTMFVTLQHYYDHHVATFYFVGKIAMCGYVWHMTKLVYVRHITKEVLAKF